MVVERRPTRMVLVRAIPYQLRRVMVSYNPRAIPDGSVRSVSSAEGC